MNTKGTLYKDGMAKKVIRAINGKDVYFIDSRSDRIKSFLVDAISQTLSFFLC